MSCIFCKSYCGAELYCLKGEYVRTTYESFNCEYYEYNGEVKEPEKRKPFNWNPKPDLGGYFGKDRRTEEWK